MKYLRLLLPATLALALNAQTNSSGPDTNAGPATAAPASAQTNGPAPANTTLPERAATEIFSDSANFDLKSRIAVYIGHVRVEDPQMKLTCDLMTARVPVSGRPDSIVAEQNVVIDATDNEGKPVHATSDKAIYTYRVSNNIPYETIELTGNPQVKSPMFSGTGDSIFWDRINNTVGATHPHMLIQPETKERTNALPRLDAPKAR